MRKLIIGLGAALLLGSNPAAAAALGFGCISDNSTTDCTIGETQLSVNVTDAGGGQVLFTFSNSGPDDSSITDVYFDDGSLLSIASVINSVGVSFSQYASPPELPAANNASPPFNTTAGFLADSNPPAQPNGVNPSETLGIQFTLYGTQTYADVLSELADGTLRIGIHVQGYTNGGTESESFVNTPLPEPGMLGLIGVGLGALALARLRRS
jgi:hypothetical protein